LLTHRDLFLDETVARWLEDDVIELAPTSDPQNNTLTLGTKKIKIKKWMEMISLSP
jgi:hypothetical protein